MVGIRSVTFQFPEKIRHDDIKEAEIISRVWDSRYPLIRTQRICLFPIIEPISVGILKELSMLCDISSIRWFNVPIRITEKHNRMFTFAYSLLSDYNRSFVNILGVEDGKIDPWILDQSAELIRKVSSISPDSKDNFRLGISVNVGADGPFFPFTYSSGKKGFSIALELTQDFNAICESERKKGLIGLREAILDGIIPQIDSINQIADSISREYGVEFKGFDFSLAPIIAPNGSIISILNSLGVYDFGRTGGLFATGYLTNILKHFASIYKSVGFSGVMYSLLEDLELCAINNQRGVTLEQLISLSTMCGCGVDMVPVYGKMTNEEFTSIFLDIIGISCKLNRKPLGIRLLPIQGCGRGSRGFTNFSDDPDFITNTKVVEPVLNLVNGLEGKFDYLTN